MSEIKVDILPLPKMNVGEGIIWCDRKQCLWWVDIGRDQVWRYAPETGEAQSWPMPDKPGCLALTEGDDILVALTGGLHRFDPKTGTLAFVAPFKSFPEGHRPNDGAVSRAGRFYIGSTALGNRSAPNARLCVFDGHDIDDLMGGLHVSNGLAFSPDDRTAYLSDSWPDVQTIWAFDHDPMTGELSQRRVYFDAEITAGRPDGACVDRQGGYWMAGVGGGEMLRLDPSGAIALRIPVPTSRPSKPCFGGANLSTLFVTSIGTGEDAAANDGRIMSIKLPFQGLAEPRIRLL
ncbi:SMP-30/gluconolactonase/LRE family protein [Nereida sp. MMG025]|uniref:SMP-30/gluconolactonase/LRE family protein n=1 Tax=Nereida sp. MMG025 TaxID=2909981 RepID=UPI001F241422|nr:SMP-30/gluconolactonase/LRE family protein [Nereida sp. MMG025]MCF6443538.1 SMP-30/gluconolactonase/LRE family protein [Nereida sp. MMG025]